MKKLMMPSAQFLMSRQNQFSQRFYFFQITIFGHLRYLNASEGALISSHRYIIIVFIIIYAPLTADPFSPFCQNALS